VAIKLLTMIY